MLKYTLISWFLLSVSNVFLCNINTINFLLGIVCIYFTLEWYVCYVQRSTCYQHCHCVYASVLHDAYLLSIPSQCYCSSCNLPSCKSWRTAPQIGTFDPSSASLPVQRCTSAGCAVGCKSTSSLYYDAIYMCLTCIT